MVCSNKMFYFLIKRSRRKLKKKALRNATVLNNGSIIRIRREKSTDGSDESDNEETDTETEDENLDDNAEEVDAEPIEEEEEKEPPEPEGVI